MLPIRKTHNLQALFWWKEISCDSLLKHHLVTFAFSSALSNFYFLFQYALPAFVTTDHISIIMCKATNASGNICSIASILWCTDGSSTGGFIKVGSGKYAYFILAYKHWWRRRSWRRWRRPSTIVMVLEFCEKVINCKCSHTDGYSSQNVRIHLAKNFRLLTFVVKGYNFIFLYPNFIHLKYLKLFIF